MSSPCKELARLQQTVVRQSLLLLSFECLLPHGCEGDHLASVEVAAPFQRALMLRVLWLLEAPGGCYDALAFWHSRTPAAWRTELGRWQLRYTAVVHLPGNIMLVVIVQTVLTAHEQGGASLR